MTIAQEMRTVAEKVYTEKFGSKLRIDFEAILSLAETTAYNGGFYVYYSSLGDRSEEYVNRLSNWLGQEGFSFKVDSQGFVCISW